MASVCTGRCDRFAIPLRFNKENGHRIVYDGTIKRCGMCAMYFAYDGKDAQCPCCNWRCRTRVLRWGKRRLDTRIRIE